MNFKEFLNEDSKDGEHHKELSEGKFLEIFRTKCKNSHAVAKFTPFFRQDKGPDLQLVTPEYKEERSAFWIDKLIKEIPGWSKMPSRSRFIKAYTDYERTFGGDDVYLLLPLDGTRIGVSPTGSFYRSFEDFKKSLGIEKVDNQNFEKWLSVIQNGFAQLCDAKIKPHEPKTFAQFKKALKQIDDVLAEYRNVIIKNLNLGESVSPEDAKIIKDLLARHVSTTERYLGEKLDPEGNGFHSVRIESFSRAPGDHEVWIDRPALLIKRTKYIELHKRGEL